MTVQNSHDSLKRTIGGTVVSVALNKTGQKSLGPLVTPAIWLYDYQKHGNKPGTIDVGILLSSAISAPAAVFASVVKSLDDDDIATKLKHVKSVEPEPYSKYIKACKYFSSNPPKINAMEIVSKGGTAWHHPIGIWVYITDANNSFVADYQPVNPTQVFRPYLPLQNGLNGRYRWQVSRK